MPFKVEPSHRNHVKQAGIINFYYFYRYKGKCKRGAIITIATILGHNLIWFKILPNINQLYCNACNLVNYCYCFLICHIYHISKWKAIRYEHNSNICYCYGFFDKNCYCSHNMDKIAILENYKNIEDKHLLLLLVVRHFIVLSL